MGEVGLEQDVVDADRVEQLAGGDALEPVAGVDLPREVLRRHHSPLLAAVGPCLQVAVVDGLEHEGDPADPALDRHELQVGEARKHAAGE